MISIVAISSATTTYIIGYTAAITAATVTVKVLLQSLLLKLFATATTDTANNTFSSLSL
jgi:hypothetical protein